MTRTTLRRAFAATTVSTVLAACAGRPSAGADAVAAPPAPVAVVAPTDAGPGPPSAHQIDSMIAIHVSTGGPAVRRAASDWIVATGEPALDRLVARLGVHAWGDELAARDLLVRSFGERAIPKLVAALDAEDRTVRDAAASLLAQMSGTWAHSDLGPDVCRALFRRLSRNEDEDRAVRSAIARSHGAGRSIVKDLGARWLARGDDAHDAALLISIFGPEAAPEAALCARSALAEVGTDDFERAEDAFLILRSYGSSDPALLPGLSAALDGAPSARRTDLLKVLATWGDAAAPAVPRIVGLLRDRDEHVRDAAADALGTMPGAAETVWRDLVGAAVNGSEHAGFAMCGLASRPEFAARLAGWLPSLDADEIPVVYDALDTGRAFDMTSLAPVLMRHPLAAARYEALVPWELRTRSDREERPIPDGALALLADEDPGVRAFAANVLASRRAAPDGRLRDVAMAARAADDPDARADAIRALGTLAARGAAPLDPILEALADSEKAVRGAAIDEIPADDAPIAGAHPEAVAGLASHVLVNDRRQRMRTALLLRLEGGAAALEAAICRQIEGDRGAKSFESRCALDAAARAGPRVGGLHPLLVELRRALADDVPQCDDLDRAIAATAPGAPLPAIPNLRDEIASQRAADASATARDRARRAGALDAMLHLKHETAPLAELVRMRDEGAVDERAAAAVALWRRTHRREEAMPTLRSILAEPGRIDRLLPWQDVGAALVEMRLGVEDVPAVVAALRSAADLSGEYDLVAANSFSGPLGFGYGGDRRPLPCEEPMFGALAALIPTLEPLGAEAASAVSALTAIVGMCRGWSANEVGEPAVRALGAIGAPARQGIPGIRIWAAQFCGNVELARAAIARIESAPR